MEEKYPIKFSLSQFILLLGVEVIVLALVFLLGARFGGPIFTGWAPGAVANGPYQQLDPQSPSLHAKGKRPLDNKLVDSVAGEENAEAQEGAEGEEAAGVLPQNSDPEAQENLQVNKSVIQTTADKNTMVRFKSSGNTKFAIEVKEYFDEVMAAQEITKLKKKGYEAYLVIDQANSSTPRYSVRVGSFGDRRVAEEFSVKMSNEQGLELRVVQAN